MPVSGSKGGILNTKATKLYVEWKIADFTALSCEEYDYICSTKFEFMGIMYNLKIYPNGYILDTGWIALSLAMLFRLKLSHSVTFTLGIKDTTIKRGPKTHIFGEDNYCHVWTKVYQKDALFKLMEEFAPNGTLTIYCHLCEYATSDTACQTTMVNSKNMLYLDFQNLLLSGQRSDVTIEVHGSEFKAHKLILEARSPVFAAMFNHEMMEKCNDIVKISDCGSDTFQHFLHYIYTGKVENLSPDDALNLYVVADKYCMPDLKENCSEFIMEEISMDTACDGFVLADRHNDTQLRNFTKEFLVRNLKMALSTSKWRLFMVENSFLAVEILQKAVEY